MPAIADHEADQTSLQFLAQSMRDNSRGKGKNGTQMYWKRPLTDSQGKRDDAPGWIMWGSDDTKSTAFMDSMMLIGRTPLPQYGVVMRWSQAEAIELIEAGKIPANSPEQYGPWGKILCHPKGPAEFPVEQVLAFGWYDPARCPVPGVKFPQLEGMTITVYDCPECNSVQYAKPVWLARHLRNTHNYDRAEIVALGEELGISFEKERARGGRVEFQYSYDEQQFAAEVERAEDGPPEYTPVVERVKPAARAEKRPRGELSPEQKAMRVAALAKARAVKAARAKTAIEG